MLSFALKTTPIAKILIAAAAFTPEAYAQVSHSVIAFLDQVEQSPPNKYSEKHYLEICEALAKSEEKIRVVTYNILFDVFDSQLKEKTHSWKERLPRVIASIETMNPDLLCLQEVYPEQLKDLQEALGKDFASFVGESKTGEMNAIFYKKERLELDLDNYSLGETNLSSASLAMPINPKDEAIVASIPNLLPAEIEPGRQMVLAHFIDKGTGKRFAVINTHLTWYRVNSREDQAYYIRDLAQKLYEINKTVVLTGDFNTSPNRPDLPLLRYQDGDHIEQIFQSLFKDSKDTALLGHIGPLSTFTADFKIPNSKAFECTGTPGVILDHIYVSPNITVLANATEPSKVDGHFPSDHMPVIADILLP